MIIRLAELSHMPKDKWLKPIPCPTFKGARRLHRDSATKIYYYKRRYSKKFPPLVFLEIEPPQEPKEEARTEEPQPAPAPPVGPITEGMIPLPNEKPIQLSFF